MSLPRRDFLQQLGLVTSAVMLAPTASLGIKPVPYFKGITVLKPLQGDDLFAYIRRMSGGFDLTLYHQLVGAANRFKEGDEIAGIAAANEESRTFAQELIANTVLKDVFQTPLFRDAQYDLIQQSTVANPQVMAMTFGALKAFLLEK